MRNYLHIAILIARSFCRFLCVINFTYLLTEVLRGLSRIGYLFDVEILSAAEVGAPHLYSMVYNRR
jgi:hypothetical protein